MWVLGQPDLSSDNYTWELFDRDVRAVPPGMRQMRNLCVCHDAMVQIAKRPLQEAVKRPQIDVSEHVEGTTYRPKDVGSDGAVSKTRPSGSLKWEPSWHIVGSTGVTKRLTLSKQGESP